MTSPRKANHPVPVSIRFDNGKTIPLRESPNGHTATATVDTSRLTIFVDIVRS